MLRHAAAALAVTIALTLGAPAFAADTVPPIAYQERTLPNGLRVFSAVDRTTPNVTVQVWYGVGSKDDPVGRSGFAHLFEHMMFKATRDMPSETIDRMTEDVGGFNNASTYDDFTNYYEVVPANHLQRLLWVESQRLGSLVVDESTFKSERDVVKEELRQSVLSQPYGRLFYLDVPRASYQIHPYKRPGIGSIEELNAATIDDVRAFHAAYYRPDNAALIVVGNFDQKELDAWVDTYFGGIKRPSEPIKRVTVAELPRTQPGVYKGYGPNVPLPAVVMTWHAPDAASPDAAALTVLDAILSSGKSSRLYNSLVYEQQVAAEVYSDATLPQQPGMVMVGAILASGKTIAEGEKALLAQVARLRDEPVTQAELTEAKNELIASKLRERETIDGRAFALGYALSTAGDPALANRELAELQAVTAADVQRVTRKYLADNARMTILYQPETARPAGEPDQTPKPPIVASTKYTGPVVTLAPASQRAAPPPIGAPVSPVLPRPAEKTLSNGLKVIVAKSSDLPLVSADLTVRTGAAADPQGLAGAMGMTASMLTEGTKTRSAQQIASESEALGATLSSGGGQESSSVSLNVMPGRLPAAMAIMADVARNPAFAQEELDRQRSQALDGLSVAFQSPGQLAGFAAAPVIFAGTPFGHVATGTPASLPKISTGDLVTLHTTYFRPDNAILVLTGDITPEQGFALAEQAFGDWKAPASPAPARIAVKPDAKPRAVAIDLPGTGQAAVTVVKASIPRSDPAYYPGIVTNSVLGGGYSARLNQEIRIKRGLSYGANSRLSAMRTTGLFRASAQTKNESAPQVLDLIVAELTRLGETPASAEELKARKSVLIGGFGRQLATTDGLADILGSLALYDLPLTEVGAYTGKVEAVTASQVQDFAKEHLNPASSSVIIAGDAKAFQAGLKTRRPDLEVVPVSELNLDAVNLRKAGK